MTKNIIKKEEKNGYVRIKAAEGYKLICQQTGKEVSEAVIKETDLALFVAK